MSKKPADNPFCHLDNQQLAVFRSWLDDHWNWESDDPTSRRLKKMLEHAEVMQRTAKIYVSDTAPLTIEDIVAGVIRIEKLTRGDKDHSHDERVNQSLGLVANHIGLHLEFFLGKDIVDGHRLMEKSGFKK